MGRWVVLSAAAFVAAAVLLPFVGPSPLDLSRVLAREAPDWSILVQLRLSRTLLGLFAGAALALGGCVFQAMLRDALATPYTLGVSTGASLGAVLAIALGWHAVGGVSAVWAGAIAGAACVLFFVLGTSVREQRDLAVRTAARRRRHQQRLFGADPAGLRTVRHVGVVRDRPLADRQPRRDRLPAARRVHGGRRRCWRS